MDTNTDKHGNFCSRLKFTLTKYFPFSDENYIAKRMIVNIYNNEY
jgi:hypothetical protein